MATTKNNFVIRVPLEMWLSIENPVSRSIFLAVYSFTDNGQKECFASARAIAKRSGYGRSTTLRHLRNLVSEKFLVQVGTKVTRGGPVKVYKVAHTGPDTIYSGPERASLTAEVAHRDAEVAQRGHDKQLKETSIACSIPIKKPTLISNNVWRKTCLAYRNSITKISGRGERINSPKGLFSKILKDEAQKGGDHKYLASVISDTELTAMIKGVAETGLPSDTYYLEAQRRGLV